MKKLVNIAGVIIEAKEFTTSKAATNFMNKKEGRNLIFSKAHCYIVSI